MASDSARRVPANPDPFGEEQHLPEEEARPQYVPLIVVDVPQVRVFHHKNFQWSSQKIIHLVMSVCSLLCFVLALRVVWWRIVWVNREALTLMQEMREVDEKVLNTTLAFSRAQTLFEECFISDSNAILNETGLPLSVCHSIIPVNEPKPHEEYFWTIKGFALAQMYVAPIVVAAASVFVVVQVAACFVHPVHTPRVFFGLFASRFLNLLLTFIVFFCGCILSNLYRAGNPGYPSPWLPVIRRLTQVYTWQLGPMLWLAGFIFQCFAAFSDLRRCKEEAPVVDPQLGVTA